MLEKTESSFGIIPLKKEPLGYKVFLIRHQAGHWSFPKGHPEGQERPQETATRELFEETGLSIASFLPHNPLQEQYSFEQGGVRIHKTVQYFIALVVGDPQLQEAEIMDGGWFSLKDASHKMSFEEGQTLCQQLINSIQRPY